jgi:hypothetical protein
VFSRCEVRWSMSLCGDFYAATSSLRGSSAGLLLTSPSCYGHTACCLFDTSLLASHLRDQWQRQIQRSDDQTSFESKSIIALIEDGNCGKSLCKE